MQKRILEVFISCQTMFGIVSKSKTRGILLFCQGDPLFSPGIRCAPIAYISEPSPIANIQSSHLLLIKNEICSGKFCYILFEIFTEALIQSSTAFCRSARPGGRRPVRPDGRR